MAHDGAPFATVLRSHRRSAGLTQQQLADLAGLGVRTIVDLEHGRVARPQRQTVRLLADALRLPDEARERFGDVAAGRPAPALAPAAAPPRRPAELPPDAWDFTGREAQAASLRQFLADGPPGAVAVVSGSPGVGKTALAVHVAHRLRPSFPDGQVFVDLRATGPRPVDPSAALASMLVSLGVDAAAVPEERTDRRALFRTVAADRAVLIVLDDALDEAQVRPLLPGGAACRVLVTCRASLPGLEGARQTRLDVLEPGEAVELLAKVTGAERVDADRETAAAIAELCGRLPLALRVAGARLAGRPGWPLRTLADRLADERRRLDELSAGDLAVRASIWSTYRSLGESARRAFRLLASLPVPDFAAWIAGPLLDLPAPGAEALVEGLVDDGLLQLRGIDATGRPRHRFHDLVRVYGRERAEEEDTPAERLAATERSAAAWLRVARQAAERLPRAHLAESTSMPDAGPPDAAVSADPRAWLDAEEAALVALIEATAAAGGGLTRAAAEITDALTSSHLAVHNRFRSWERTQEAALRASRLSADPRGEAVARAGMGRLRREQDRYRESEAWLRSALDGFAHAGDEEGEASTRIELGTLFRETGRFAAATGQLDLAASLVCGMGGDGLALISYVRGTVSRELGRDGEAVVQLQDALGRFRGLGDLRREALVLRSISLAHRARGDLRVAEALASAAHALFLELDDRLLAAYSSQSLAKIAVRRGSDSDAAMHLRSAAASFWELEDRFGIALAMRTLGELHLAAGRLGEARERLSQTQDLWRSLELPLWEARTLRDLGGVLVRSGDHQGAHRAWGRALSTFVRAGSRDAAELTGWRLSWGCDCDLPRA
jgi:transcriptional regulator with XRE-family HTH domain/tetratricopeptide (TPR) repeat protein